MTGGMLFPRAYEIQVGDLGVETLRVGFTVEKTLKRHPNTCELAIYNLAPESRKKLDEAGTVPVRIAAGYGAKTTEIFVGELRESYSRPDTGANWVTVLTAGDGDQAIRKARTNRGVRPGVSVQRTVTQLVQDMGVGIGNAAKALLTGDLEGVGRAFGDGLTLSGSSADQMDKVLRSAGYEWSVQDGELLVLEAGQAKQGSITVLSPLTGLEGTPELDGKGLCKIRCRIVPDTNPGQLVQVTSATVKGFWRIEKVRYVGDTHGPDWNAELECREVGAVL